MLKALCLCRFNGSGDGSGSEDIISSCNPAVAYKPSIKIIAIIMAIDRGSRTTVCWALKEIFKDCQQSSTESYSTSHSTYQIALTNSNVGDQLRASQVRRCGLCGQDSRIRRHRFVDMCAKTLSRMRFGSASMPFAPKCCISMSFILQLAMPSPLGCLSQDKVNLLLTLEFACDPCGRIPRRRCLKYMRTPQRKNEKIIHLYSCLHYNVLCSRTEPLEKSIPLWSNHRCGYSSCSIVYDCLYYCCMANEKVQDEVHAHCLGNSIM